MQSKDFLLFETWDGWAAGRTGDEVENENYDKLYILDFSFFFHLLGGYNRVTFSNSNFFY